MKDLIKYDLYRLVKSRKLWLVYLFSIAICLYYALTGCKSFDKNKTVAFLDLVMTNDSVVLILPVFIIIFVVDEFANGYIKNTWSINPFCYAISKGLCVLMFSVAYLALTWTITFIAGSANFQKLVFSTKEAMDTGWYKVQILCCLFNFACGIEAGMIALTVSVIIKTYLPWIIVHLIYKFLAYMLVCDIIKWTTGVDNGVALILPITGGAKYYGWLAEYFSNTVAIGKAMNFQCVLAPFGIVLCWCIIAIAVCGFVLKRKKI